MYNMRNIFENLKSLNSSSNEFHLHPRKTYLLINISMNIRFQSKSIVKVSATFGPMKMFKKKSLSFHVVSKTFIAQNYLSVIPSDILHFFCLNRSFLAHFKSRDNRDKHVFEKHYYCGDYSDDVCQCLNTDQIFLKIQNFCHNTL